MKIAAFSVKNHSFTLILFVMVMLLGANSLLNMPRSEDPDLESPFFAVVAIYPGVSPQDMEKLVADPVEESLSELEEVKQIISDIGDGVSALIFATIPMHRTSTRKSYARSTGWPMSFPMICIRWK
jgi:multidrug efflux pump subunit AcrB